MHKGFAPIFLLLIITVAVVGLLFFQKSTNQSQLQTPSALEISPDPYQAWKTYKNSTYGFTLRYPSNWHVKEYQDYAADFYATDPKEATSGAIKVRFSRLQDKVDLAEFEKIHKAKVGKNIYEPLDIKSVITKNKNFEVGKYPAIDYSVNRDFTALEGPRTQHRHIYEINKEGVILSFLSTAQTENEYQIFDPIFQKMVSSIKF